MKRVKTKYPGIEKQANGKYLVTKFFNGKRHRRICEGIKNALEFKSTFHPLAQQLTATNPLNLNGTKTEWKLKRAVEEYFNNSELSTNTKHRKGLRMNAFLVGLCDQRMVDMNSNLISAHILECKKKVIGPSRCNFDKELKDLTTIFNWYIEVIDFSFKNPVLKSHRKIGYIKRPQDKKKDLTADELSKFISALNGQYQAMAELQFLTSTRVGEIAALNTNVVDFDNRVITISDSIRWEKGKPRHENSTKTGVCGKYPMTEGMYQVLLQLDKARPLGCKFFFHLKGKLLRYEKIRLEYSKALKTAGLTHYSGTHIMRHTAATLARQMASREIAQSLLRHKSSRMTEHYAKQDTAKDIESGIKILSEVIRVSHQQPPKSLN